jgi:copper(I)-binding protein
MSKKISAAIAAIALATTLSACATAEEHPQELNLTDGWVRVSEYSDHVDGMTGAFATLDNHTDHDITIVGGSAEIAGMVQVHEVVMVDGAMKMQEKEGGIVIPAGESVTLEPGGLHIMLMGLKKPILVGDKVTLTIDLDGYEDQTVTWDAKTSLSGDEEYKPSK